MTAFVSCILFGSRGNQLPPGRIFCAASDVDPELYDDVVEDMCTVSVVVLIKTLPHSTAEMSE